MKDDFSPEQVSGCLSKRDNIQIYHITKIRTSFNLNENAIGMEFFSVNSAYVPVDGNPDTIDESVVLSPEGINRLLFKGPQGTFVNNFIVPQLGDTQGLFFKR